MARQDQYDLRTQMLDALLEKVANDQYPSTTMLDMIEEMLTPEDVPVYTEMLLSRIRSDRWPSVPMLARVKALQG